jgi:uncharacterized protein (TIGR03000 family)
MLRNIFSSGGVLLLVGAAVLATPGSGWAQHRGGGHFGGAHVGGYRGIGHYGFSHGYGHVGYGYHHSYGPYYGSYGSYYPYYSSYPYNYAYPSYSSYSNYPSTNPYNYGGSSTTTSSGYFFNYGDAGPSTANLNQDNFPAGTAQPAAAQTDNRARVNVSVPADAEITFNGAKTTSTGSVRKFQSPPLTPGKQYSYEVQARWIENGKEVTQTQEVQVTAGANLDVRFPVASGTAGLSPTVKKN